jgi:hypothetical protein
MSRIAPHKGESYAGLNHRWPNFTGQNIFDGRITCRLHQGIRYLSIMALGKANDHPPQSPAVISTACQNRWHRNIGLIKNFEIDKNHWPTKGMRPFIGQDFRKTGRLKCQRIDEKTFNAGRLQQTLPLITIIMGNQSTGQFLCVRFRRNRLPHMRIAILLKLNCILLRHKHLTIPSYLLIGQTHYHWIQSLQIFDGCAVRLK